MCTVSKQAAMWASWRLLRVKGKDQFTAAAANAFMHVQMYCATAGHCVPALNHTPSTDLQMGSASPTTEGLVDGCSPAPDKGLTWGAQCSSCCPAAASSCRALQHQQCSLVTLAGEFVGGWLYVHALQLPGFWGHQTVSGGSAGHLLLLDCCWVMWALAAAWCTHLAPAWASLAG
jgi:hypothetical protein